MRLDSIFSIVIVCINLDLSLSSGFFCLLYLLTGPLPYAILFIQNNPSVSIFGEILVELGIG